MGTAVSSARLQCLHLPPSRRHVHEFPWFTWLPSRSLAFIPTLAVCLCTRVHHERRLFPRRESCDELRSELFSDHQKKVCEERKAQVAFNEELKRQKLVEEQMFSKLWEEDRLAKERREASEARRQRELAENTRLGLKAQITGVLAQRRMAQRQKEEEARLVVRAFCVLGDRGWGSQGVEQFAGLSCSTDPSTCAHSFLAASCCLVTCPNAVMQSLEGCCTELW